MKIKYSRIIVRKANRKRLLPSATPGRVNQKVIQRVDQFYLLQKGLAEGNIGFKIKETLPFSK